MVVTGSVVSGCDEKEELLSGSGRSLVVVTGGVDGGSGHPYGSTVDTTRQVLRDTLTTGPPVETPCSPTV